MGMYSTNYMKNGWKSVIFDDTIQNWSEYLF